MSLTIRVTVEAIKDGQTVARTSGTYTGGDAVSPWTTVPDLRDLHIAALRKAGYSNG